MPQKIPFGCSTPLCPRLSTSGGRCSIHARAHSIAYEQSRSNRGDRGYASASWRATRQAVLDAVGHVCQECHVNRATEVHHVRPKQATPLPRAYASDQTPLIALCKTCHSRLSIQGY